MDKKLVVKYSYRLLKQKGPMASITLRHRLWEDYGIDVSSRELAAILRINGKDRIKSREVINERNFGSYIDGKVKIYEADF